VLGNHNQLKDLWCPDNQLTSLDASGCGALETLYAFYNQLTSLSVNSPSLGRLYVYSNRLNSGVMGQIVENLPTRSDDNRGYLAALVDEDPSGDVPEENVITTAQISQANAKNWDVYHWSWDSGAWELYAGNTFIPGDVNDDGHVNISDVTALIDYLLNNANAINVDAADMNGDGSVNISDVTGLIDYLLSGAWPVLDEVFVVNGVSFKMVGVEGGTFTMGATPEQGDDADESEKPAHQVTLSSYSIGETEVTQGLWLAVMGTNPSYFTGDLNKPVERVSWYDYQTFISKLNAMTGLNFRLPTEAEWEFAARGGLQSKGYKYAGSNILNEVSWYVENSAFVGVDSPDYGTHAVATKKANELGLYDMTGNVSEWVRDWYENYSSGSQTNPTGPSTGSYHIHRGGGYDSYPSSLRVSYRAYTIGSITGNDLGLRLAL
jgi:formylglycine-generating enzyme required for sulfatase activity